MSEIDGVVFVNDRVAGTTFCSGQVEQMLGFPPETMVLPGVWRGLVVDEDVERAIDVWEGSDDRDEYDLEYRMRRADGAVIWVEERWRATRDAGGDLRPLVGGRHGHHGAQAPRGHAGAHGPARGGEPRRGRGGPRLRRRCSRPSSTRRGTWRTASPPDDPRFEDVRAIGDSVRRGVQLTKQLLAFGRDRDETEAAPLDVAWLLADLEQILRGIAGTADLEIHVAANGLTRITRSAWSRRSSTW